VRVRLKQHNRLNHRLVHFLTSSTTLSGPPKTCDVAALATHYLTTGCETHMEPLTVRFPDAEPGTLIADWSTAYVLGFSRALAAICIVETMVSLTWSLEEAADVSKVADTVRYLYCNYMPEQDAKAIVEKTIALKMRGSERQRPDVVQLARVFSYAAHVKASQGTVGHLGDILNGVMTEYNKTQVVQNCRLEGAERQVVKFLCLTAPGLKDILRLCWNEFRVRESPITVHTLASSFLTAPPQGVNPQQNPKWFQILTPDNAKYECWARRLIGAFKSRLDKARAEQKNPILRTRAVRL